MLLHDRWIIPLVQHLAGLATAAAGYAVLIRFDWRYQLPQLALIPVAAVLGVNVIISRLASSSQRERAFRKRRRRRKGKP
jgi:uncharacterized protein HemY